MKAQGTLPDGGIMLSHTFPWQRVYFYLTKLGVKGTEYVSTLPSCWLQESLGLGVPS